MTLHSPSRPSAAPSLRWDLLALLVVGLGCVAYLLHKDPVPVSSSNPEVAGTLPPPGHASTDVLLVLPDRPEDAPPAPSFGELDMAMGWFNTLSQEVGAFDHTTPRAFDRESLGRRRLIVISASAAAAFPTDLHRALEGWVEAGGVLLLEQPTSAWQPLLGGIGVAQEAPRPTRRITAADGAPLRGALRDALLDAPFQTTLRPFLLTAADRQRPDLQILLEVDGRPALLHLQRGAGHVYATSVDIARAVMTLQQGRPGTDFTVPLAEVNASSRYIRPGDLVAAPKMLEARVPYADLIERNMLESVAMHTPLPRIWYFPGHFAGVFISTHSEDGAGDRVRHLAAWEQRQGRGSTFFVTDVLSGEDVAALASDGFDVQLQWVRPDEDGRGLKPSGIGPWRPMRAERSLDEQRRAVEGGLVKHPVTISRILHGDLDPHWSSTFQKLAAQQLVADSSYGPTRDKEYGFLFGTGLPFYPLDPSGLLIPIAEIPYLFRDDHNVDEDMQRRFIIGSEAGFHQLLTVSFEAEALAYNPTVEGVRAWQSGPRIAEAHNHWATSLKNYLLFEEARRTSTLKSTFIVSERRLEIVANIAKPRIPGVGEEGSPHVNLLPSLAIPQAYEGTTVETVRVDGTVVPFKNIGRSADGFYHTVKLPPGEHTIHVCYQGKPGDP